LPTCAISRRGL